MEKARGGQGGIAPRCAEWFRPPKPLLFRGGVWGGGRRCGHTTPLRLGPAAPDKSRCPSSEEEGVSAVYHRMPRGNLRRARGQRAPPRLLFAAAHIGRKPHFERKHHVDERSEEHTSELQSLMRISYAVFCLKNKTQ